MVRINIGVIGAGYIAEIMSKTLIKTPGVRLYAICSRHGDNARKLAEKYSYQKVYNSAEELVQDQIVDLVYIAAYHSAHYKLLKTCIACGKPALCEKPFTANADQAMEIFNLAKERNVFVGEAFWTRFLPINHMVRKEIENGTIGEVRMVTAGIGGPIDNQNRIREPELAGGALLDVGLYGIAFASMWLGTDVRQVTGTCTKLSTGVDSEDGIFMIWDGNRSANLTCSTHSLIPKIGIISGSEGCMVFDNINNPSEVWIYDRSQSLIRTIIRPDQITGYEYEVLAAVKAIREGRLECMEIPHRETLRILEITDGLRRDWGIVYPWEK